ncbi:uncharacterized protein K489DRAFT_368369 [Dissoconium aciculare CBS 342.82]|uniref:Uncharacterized protein n=1 Tax=Dissoconium aciculare CBS 342.82 TaxID=1314786 RepID=A0A6J3MC40_9PEZI|nr:uncharacterized protein K489DRAFT_368369 [Dissoconium aciculare CBS 342.82]KAF1825179.1 hypothetical protein K489DRAFT_368369 [Dissoconium aciculare CBS 342.82]
MWDHKPENNPENWGRSCLMDVKLLSACRQVHSEAHLVPCRSNVFTFFRLYQPDITVLKVLSPAQRAAIRCIYVNAWPLEEVRRACSLLHGLRRLRHVSFKLAIAELNSESDETPCVTDCQGFGLSPKAPPFARHVEVVNRFDGVDTSRHRSTLGFLELDICISPILQSFPANAGHRCCPILCWKLVEVPCVTIGLEEVHVMFN